MLLTSATTIFFVVHSNSCRNRCFRITKNKDNFVHKLSSISLHHPLFQLVYASSILQEAVCCVCARMLLGIYYFLLSKFMLFRSLAEFLLECRHMWRIFPAFSVLSAPFSSINPQKKATAESSVHFVIINYLARERWMEPCTTQEKSSTS